MEFSIVLHFILVVTLNVHKMPISHVHVIEILNVVSTVALFTDLSVTTASIGFKATFTCTTDWFYGIVCLIMMTELVLMIITGDIIYQQEYRVEDGYQVISFLAGFKWVLYCIRFLKFIKICSMHP